MVSQHDLFSQGPWGRRKLWKLLLPHLTNQHEVVMLSMQL